MNHLAGCCASNQEVTYSDLQKLKAYKEEGNRPPLPFIEWEALLEAANANLVIPSSSQEEEGE